MNTRQNKIKKTSLPSKEVKENQIWSSDKIDKVREFILSESKKQSPERKLRNEFLSIKYQMQDYIEKDKIEREMQILDFVKLYLKLLRITKKRLAQAFEMEDTNLYKYLIGERKLNADIVLKLSSFSHTKPELWYRIQIKNELNELKKEKQNLKEYEKYDYKNFVSI
jgi:plasmid maintenance system antidote protein VapI